VSRVSCDVHLVCVGKVEQEYYSVPAPWDCSPLATYRITAVPVYIVLVSAAVSKLLTGGDKLQKVVREVWLRRRSMAGLQTQWEDVQRQVRRN
jgi:hypothetical protein